MGKRKNRKTDKQHPIESPPLKRHRKVHHWLNVLPNDLWLKVPRGETILHALQTANIDLEGDCGGIVKCGKCRVKVLTSIDLPKESEVHDLLDEDEIYQGIRLACSTKINKDLAVYIGDGESEKDYYQILKAGDTPVVELTPLVEKRIVNLTPHNRNNGASNLDSLRTEMGNEYSRLNASLHCLQRLPDMLRETSNYGAAVLHKRTLLDWQAHEKASESYGLVFDIGTSTVVGKLINLLDGKQTAVISRLNRQSRYGSNVISRIQYAREHDDGLLRMHDMIIKDLHLIIDRLLEVSGLRPEDIFIAVAAGNTTMQHFLLGLDPTAIAEAPFTPVLNDGMTIKAREAGLMLHPEAMLYVMPTKSGYIGGDLLSVILASEAAEQDDSMILGLDLGTNGEIFLGNRKRMMTCSAAAGPALEGAKITHGMIAKAGAIEGVRLLDGKLLYQEVGNVKPKGLCGSGLVDLVAELLNCGIINTDGLIGHPLYCSEGGLGERIVERRGVYNFLFASEEESYYGRNLYLTQKDVRELQLAKSAIAAGVQTLMDEMGIAPDDISRVYLAGALGNYVNPYSAIRIGLLPMINPKKIFSLGNAASTGASMVLLSKDYWRWANELVHFIEHVELSSRRDFTDYFISKMDFPEENPWERRAANIGPEPLSEVRGKESGSE